MSIIVFMESASTTIEDELYHQATLGLRRVVLDHYLLVTIDQRPHDVD